MSNEFFIRQTLELASKGLGATWPNPMVGSVIVKDGRVIGEGHHVRSGEDHAELAAIKNCSESPEGATVYVNLEPCCHTNKKTPPCAQKLILEKVKKVVICNLDPNPLVNGQGVELLRSHGIEVEHGILSAEGERLNEVFFLNQRLKRPFVYLKMASTLDGRIALPSGESKWITGELARAEVHRLRSLHQVVMVGAETVRKDDPKLNVRFPNFHGPQPFRAIISKSGKLPQGAQIFTDELKDKTLIYSSITEAMDDLWSKKLINIFLEGGPRLAGSFLEAGLVDRVGLFINPSLLGAGPSVIEGQAPHSLEARLRLKSIETSTFSEDLFITGRTSKTN